jgi:hypothetical protein
MKKYWEWRYTSLTHVFLTSALNEGEWSVSLLGSFIPRENIPGTYWIGDWVGPRAGLDAVEKRKILPLPGIEPSPPSLIPSLYRRSYPDSKQNKT